MDRESWDESSYDTSVGVFLGDQSFKWRGVVGQRSLETPFHSDISDVLRSTRSLNPFITSLKK